MSSSRTEEKKTKLGERTPHLADGEDAPEKDSDKGKTNIDSQWAPVRTKRKNSDPRCNLTTLTYLYMSLIYLRLLFYTFMH